MIYPSSSQHPQTILPIYGCIVHTCAGLHSWMLAHGNASAFTIRPGGVRMENARKNVFSGSGMTRRSFVVGMSATAIASMLGLSACGAPSTVGDSSNATAEDYDIVIVGAGGTIISHRPHQIHAHRGGRRCGHHPARLRRPLPERTSHLCGERLRTPFYSLLPPSSVSLSLSVANIFEINLNHFGCTSGILA